MRNTHSKAFRFLFLNIFSFLFYIFLIILISLSFYLLMPMKSQKIIYIPKGSSKSIISYLRSQGYALNPMDAYILHFIGNVQSGWIEIADYPENPESKTQDRHQDETKEAEETKEDPTFTISLTKGKFLYLLTTSKSAMKSVTLIPGETSYFFLRQIANVFNVNINDLEKFYAQYSPLSDGVILADTYSLPLHSDAEFIIKYLIDTSLSRHKKLAMQMLGKYDERTWFSIIAKASIIQKEAANIDEMPIVASVIDNRVAKNMPLQMDGSLNYGEFSHTKITPTRIRDDTSEFNTYKYTGLPRTPSGAVSLSAINAALNPAKTNYLYFVRNKTTQLHDFSENYKEHTKKIQSSNKTAK